MDLFLLLLEDVGGGGLPFRGANMSRLNEGVEEDSSSPKMENMDAIRGQSWTTEGYKNPLVWGRMVAVVL